MTTFRIALQSQLKEEYSPDNVGPRVEKMTRQKHAREFTGRKNAFQPGNMLGRYAIRSPFLEKLAAKQASEGDSPEIWLEIHSLVESETGFLASFDFGVVAGVMLIAGSRRTLQALVEEEDKAGDGSGEDVTSDEEEEEEKEGEDEEEEKDDTERLSFEAPPELDRPSHAFEKNTFRTPKWFAQWRGSIASSTSPDRQASTQPDNKAHFEFSSAACRDFDATFSCPEMEAKEVAVKGWKVTGKATPATASWREACNS